MTPTGGDKRLFVGVRVVVMKEAAITRDFSGASMTASLQRKNQLETLHAVETRLCILRHWDTVRPHFPAAPAFRGIIPLSSR